MVGVPHNWIKGDLHKWARAVETDSVAVNDTPGFIDRARLSMKSGVYWDAYEQAERRSEEGRREDSKTGTWHHIQKTKTDNLLASRAVYYRVDNFLWKKCRLWARRCS